ncbi:hypothetical protein ACFE04_005896 [Oxalis oulophora]
MEVKLSHCCSSNTNSSRVLLLFLPYPKKLQSFSKTSFKKHIRDLTLKWRIQLEEISQGQQQHSSFTHIVKQGETLTSISKLYGISIYSIAAANKNVLPLDLVFYGQHLNIPMYAAGRTTMEKMQRLRNTLEFSRENVFTMLRNHHLPHAKTTGFFLVVVPLIAFCIRCIISAVNSKVVKRAGEIGLNRSKGHPHASESKSQRWRCALSDISDPDNLQSNVEDDEEQVSSKELSIAYEKLEHDYAKFLSQCGMSRWGQWRGGDSPG